VGFYPLELCSSGAAVRRLRRLCPLVVETSFLLPRLPPTFRFLGVQRARSAALRAPLAFRALLHTRVCHLGTGCLDRPERMALLGFVVLQGFLPPRHNRAFTRFPLTSFPASTQAGTTEIVLPRSPPPAPQGFRYRGDWLGLSFAAAETTPPSKPADPLELPAPFDHPNELETPTGPGVTSSSIGVHRCPLTCSL
jgi:hypothetical protein